jgi:hypothetical protein
MQIPRNVVTQILGGEGGDRTRSGPIEVEKWKITILRNTELSRVSVTCGRDLDW